MDTYDDATEFRFDESSIMGGDLSKVPSSRKLENGGWFKSLTMNPSKISLISGSE